MQTNLGIKLLGGLTWAGAVLLLALSAGGPAAGACAAPDPGLGGPRQDPPPSPAPSPSPSPAPSPTPAPAPTPPEEPPPVEADAAEAPAWAPSPVFERYGLSPPEGLPPNAEFRSGDQWTVLYDGGCWDSDRVCELPTAELAGRTVVFDDAAASWGEHGPKWGLRVYNATGVLRGLTLWRAGDFSEGREGHGGYFSAFQDLTIEDCAFIQCGAQGLQIVWRSHETKIPPETWNQAAHVVTVRNVRMQDCGQINAGSAVRASWPCTIFAPGQAIVVDRLTVRTRFKPYADGQHPLIESHGALFIGPGDEYRRTPKARVEGLDCEVWNSDRQELVLWAQDDALVLRPLIVDHGGRAEIAIVDDCGRVEIREPLEPLTVGIYAGHPHQPARETFEVPAGGTFVWPKEPR